MRVLSHKNSQDPLLKSKDLLKFSSISPPRTNAKIRGGIGKSYNLKNVATFFVENNFLSLILSFCPGGIYEVAVIAIAFDLEPDFVAFHHIIRLLFILFIVPVILRLVEKTKIKN